MNPNLKVLDKWGLLFCTCAAVSFVIAGAILRDIDVILVGVTFIVAAPLVSIFYYFYLKGMEWFVEKVTFKRDGK